jgi:protein O-GlcNAc transferase
MSLDNKILAMNPQLQAQFQQAIQAFQDGNFEGADLILKEVLQNDINSANAVFELGIAYAKANRFMEASAIFCCLQLCRNNDVRIPYNLGLIHSLQGRHLLALEAYDAALKIQPNDVETLINKGSTCIDTKNYPLALEVLEKAIQIKPYIAEAWNNKGIALNNLNFYQDSITAYNEAIKLNPNYYEAWSNQSVPLKKLKLYKEALHACDKALNLKPDYAEAWNDKGSILIELKRYDEALTHYDKALSLKPDYVDGWSNKGVTLDELKRYDEALTHYDKALSLKPDYVKAWSNKGDTLNELKRYDEAIAHYDKAINLKADIDWIYGDLIYTKMKICDWSKSEGLLEFTKKQVMLGKKFIQPFQLLALVDDALLHKKCSEIYVSDYSTSSSLDSIPRRLDYSKIRIGYFSADFKNHPVAFLAAQLFESHDKSKFETYAFSLTEANDDMRSRLVKAFDYFINVETQSDIQIAQLARSLNIDIAVDLTGFTKDSRTGIFSCRVAPIQANYLGYPGTMGADFIDYIIADKILISPELESYYSEKIVYLPNSYQVNDRKREISDKKFTRQELGLPKNGFVFCCFNNNYKILPVTFASWMRILNAVEDSVLWLFQDNSWAVENLKNEAIKEGIAVNRLVFAGFLPPTEHLARQSQADLFLDTFPYNAHTTASDALWVGLPVLTLIGRSFASRVAASLLSAIGLPELITNSQEEYEALAIELAVNSNKLADIKLKLANNRLNAPLFDTPLFTKNLEAAFIEMYERYRADLEPNHITNA